MDDDTLFIVWFAGFYEGEGCVCNDKSNNNRLRVSVSQNDKYPLIKAQKKWGGTIRERKRVSIKGKECFGHEWRLCHNDSLKFLEDIRPHMIIPYKINQVEKALYIMKLGNNEKYNCSFCDSTFSSPSGRRRHEKNQHINKGEYYICNICGLSYNSIDSLKRHIKIKKCSATSICYNDKCDTS